MNGDEIIIATVSAHLESFSGGMCRTGCMDAKVGVTAESEGTRG